MAASLRCCEMLQAHADGILNETMVYGGFRLMHGDFCPTDEPGHNRRICALRVEEKLCCTVV